MSQSVTPATTPKAPERRPASLVLDIGGTKIAYGIVPDDAPLQVLGEGRMPAQPEDASIQEQVALAVRRANAAAEGAGVSVVRVGVGAPGVVVAPSGLIVSAGPTIPGWQGTDVASIVASVLPVPVACHNDVRIWAFGEHLLGAGRGFGGRILYVSVGTGIGGALANASGLIGGPTGTAGELSELVAADCRGYADRAENIASGPSLARYYEALRANPATGRIPWASSGPAQVELRDVLECMANGDELATTVINGNLEGLGQALGALASVLDLDAIVLGGGVVGIGSVITEPIERGIRRAALVPNKTIPVKTSELSGNAPLVAAAAYARSIS